MLPFHYSTWASFTDTIRHVRAINVVLDHVRYPNLIPIIWEYDLISRSDDRHHVVHQNSVFQMGKESSLSTSMTQKYRIITRCVVNSLIGEGCIILIEIHLSELVTRLWFGTTIDDILIKGW